MALDGRRGNRVKGILNIVMQIHQFKLQYSPEQDRIVFLLNTITQDEFRFYLTRRFVNLLWPVLQKLIKDDYRKKAPDNTQIADALMAFEKEKVLPQIDFGRQFAEEIKQFPLGEEIILLSRISVKKTDEGSILCLLPTRGRGVELPANRKLLFGFSRVLKDMVGKAEWNLDLAEGGDTSLMGGSRVLH